MKLLIVLLVSLSGCAQYTQVQMKLVEQARKGVSAVADAGKSRADLAEQLRLLRRQRLDEAFDADVRANGELDADWVIAHRRAYAAAIEAYARAEAASATAQAAERQTLADTDAALQKLYWLQSIQLRYLSLEEISK